MKRKQQSYYKLEIKCVPSHQMKNKYRKISFLLLCLFFFGGFFQAQVINKTDSNRVKPQDTLVIDSGKKDSLQIFKPTIFDYTYKTQFSIPFSRRIKLLSFLNITTRIILVKFNLPILVPVSRI